MEKSRKATKSIFGKRLLILCLFFIFIFQAHSLFALEVLAQSESAVCGSQTLFTLHLPDISPASVEFVSPLLPDDVTCLAAKKSAYVEDEGQSGTLIELWIAFYKDGYYELPNLEVYIEDLHYSIPFAPFQVYKNPQDIAPEIFLEYDMGVKDGTAAAGDEIVFTVYARYFIQVASFSWNIPENALFRLVEQYDFSSNTRKEFSSNKVKIATFAWTPLVPGVVSLPNVKLSVTSYSGTRKDLSLSSTGSLHIMEATKEESTKAQEEEKTLFAYAFTPVESDNEELEIAEPVSTEIAVLSRLRDKERRSLPFSNTRLVRRQVETAMGLVNGEDEPYVIIPILFWILTAASFVLFIVFLKKKKLAKAFIFSFTFICVLVCAIVFTARQIVPYGVFTGGSIYPIPEKSAKTSFYIHGGNRVRIIEETQGWLYISFNNIEGWVPSEMVEPIKSISFEIEK